MVTIQERQAIDDHAPLPKVADGLQSGCAVCGETENVKVCAGCYVVSYCGRDHQAVHRQAHRFLCDGVKSELQKLEASEAYAQVIQAGPYPPLAMDPVARMDDQQGFRLFMTYQQSPLPLYLRRINTVEAVQELQWYFQRCEQLASPAYSFYFQIASLEISARLGQDQRFYDSIKTLCTFKTINRPFTEFKDEDVFEPIDFIIEPRESTWYERMVDLLILMTYFKMKLLLDLIRLDQTKQLLSQFPRGIISRILMAVPQSPTVVANRAIMTKPELSAEIMILKSQIRTLVSEVRDRNSYFFRMLAFHNPLNVMVERLTQQEMDDVEFGQAKRLMLSHAYYWFELPGAIPMLHQLYLV